MTLIVLSINASKLKSRLSVIPFCISMTSNFICFSFAQQNFDLPSDLLYIYSPLLGIPDYIFGMRLYMRFSSANPRRLTRIISPVFSSSFKERLTVISDRESSAASCLTGKYTNKLSLSSSISPSRHLVCLLPFISYYSI